MSGDVWGLSWGLIVVLGLGVLYDLLAEAALRHWLKEPAPDWSEPLEPITFFRPLKRGVPRLREKLEALIAASLPGDQILFGVDEDSEEEAICEEVRRAFPRRDIAVVRCAVAGLTEAVAGWRPGEEGRFATAQGASKAPLRRPGEPGVHVNPKISKLVQMEGQARHAAWLLSDSEVVFDAEFLMGFRGEWQAKQDLAALTAAYRFVNLVSGPQRCDALAVLMGLWPGLALVRRFGRVRFTLGACTLVRREALAAVGGWKAFVCDLAEDHQLGAALAAAGQTVQLSRQIVTLDSDPMSWGEYWRHQRRVAVTYRAANPAGFAGMVVAHGLVGCIFYCLARPPGPTLLLTMLIATLCRASRIHTMAGALHFKVKRLQPLWLLASFVEALCWFLSWFSSTVWWSGRRWRVDFRGKLSRPSADRS